MTKRTSTSYQFTADVNSIADMMAIGTLKTHIAALNARNVGIPKRVVLRGRKPIVKQFVSNSYPFMRKSKSPVGYDFSGNIVGGIKNATMIDVYVYDR